MTPSYELKSVSIINPIRNEEKCIGACPDSIPANDHPKDKLEILVVDGMSSNRTRTIVEEYVISIPGRRWNNA